MDSFCVRPIRKDELPALLGLYRYLHEDELPAGADQLEAVWNTIWDNSSLLLYFVGELNGQIVASCTLTIIPNLTHQARPYGLIENVVTHPDHRGQGFATQTLQVAQQVAWDRGCYKVMLLTGSKLESTLRFYDQAGFARGIKTGFIAYPTEQE